jgi:4-amino-4-deoxy-L-arabinose transferase-like glycosyltransferase
VERLGIAMGAVLVVLAAFVIGRALRSTTTGLVAALAVATAPRVVWFARKIFIDVYLTTFTSLALAAFVLAHSRPAHRRRYLILMYVALALGVLTKGPVAIVIPALVCFVWLAGERRLSDVTRLMLVPGAAIVLAIVLPWYVAVYLQHGWTYITEFLFDENLRRYATTAMTPADRNVAFYVPVLLGELFPWAPLVIAPLISVAARWRGAAGPAASFQRLLWLWIAAFVVIFSFSRTKEDLYIFPVIPAVAALVASALTEAFNRSPGRLLSMLFGLVAALCVIAAAGLLWLFGPSAGFYALPEIRPYAAVLAMTGVAAGALWFAARRPAAVAALASGLIALNYVFVGLVLPAVERTKPVPPLARTIAQRAAPDAKLGYFNMGLQSFVYYTDRGRVEDIGIAPQARAFFLDQRESWAIMGVEEWNQVRALVPGVCVADRHSLSLFDARLPDIIARKPPEDVLLVKNHCDG